MSCNFRLFYVDDIPTPYRVGVFHRFSRIFDGVFHVAFCAADEPGRSFEIDTSGLDTQVLKGYQLRPIGQVNPFSFKFNPNIVKSLNAFKPDVVILSGYAHPTMWIAAIWCMSHDIPYAISCETSSRSTATTGARWYLRRWVIGWMVRNMSFGLPVGREAADYLERMGAGSKPMYFFPNTTDTSFFEKAYYRINHGGNPTEFRKRFYLPVNGALFVFVGRFISAKRPIDAIKAFKQLPSDCDAGLLLVGDGPEREAVLEAAGDHPCIGFAGWIKDSSELAQVFAEASALILPSSHEPWGAVVNEAMAASTPVIATDRVGAAVELIQDGVDGYIVPVGDIDAIRDAMFLLAKDAILRNKMGEAARRKATSHGADYAAENLLKGVAWATKKSHGQE